MAPRPLCLGIMADEFPKLSETFVLHHITAMIDRGLDVRVFASRPEGEEIDRTMSSSYELGERTMYFDQNLSIPRRLGLSILAIVHNARSRAWSSAWRNMFWLPRRAVFPHCPGLMDAFLRQGPIPLLHCHFGPNGVAATHLKRLGLVDKLIVTFHGYDVSRALEEPGTVEAYRKLFDLADMLLPVSEHWAQRLRELGAPKEKIRVHHMGIDIERFPFEPRVPSDGRVRLLTTARLTEKKGIRYAIEALSLLAEQRPDIEFQYHLVGDGPLAAELSDLIRHYGLESRVTCHGALPHEQVKKLLYETDVFLLPSVTASDGDKEGIPVALMEAMASGMPIVSTHHSGIPELVENGVTGYLAPERDSASLAQAILRIVDDPQHGKAMVGLGRKRVEMDFNESILNDQLKRMYFEVGAVHAGV